MDKQIGNWFGLVGLVALVAGLSACSSDDGSSFGSGGNGFDGFTDSDDTGSSGDDTGGSVEENPDAPVITEMRAGFEDYPNIGMVLEVGIKYTDANDDVDGGQLILGIQEGDSQESDEVITDIGGEHAYIDSSGEIILASADFDTGLDYTITAIIQDVAGNASQTSSASTSE